MTASRSFPLALILGCTFTFGCASAIPESSSTGSETAVDAGVDSSESDSGLDGSAEPLTSVREGPWRTVNAAIDGDPCGFNSYTSSFGYPVLAYLPYNFEVRPASGGFYIEATPYNLVRGPIFCTVDGTEFDCEEQTVIAFDDWLYEIEFSGEQTGPESLSGTAVVRFEVDAETELQIGTAGFQVSDCDHSIDLELEFGRF